MDTIEKLELTRSYLVERDGTESLPCIYAIDEAIRSLHELEKYKKALNLSCAELATLVNNSMPANTDFNVIIKAYEIRYKRRAGLE